MLKQRLVWILPVAALILIGASCGKSVAEKTVENTIERSTNGQADVDIDTNTVSINVNGSSWQAGDQVKLPSDWPSDVYVADGTLKTAVTTRDIGWTISLESTQSVSAIKAVYDQKLPTAGWTINSSGNFGSAVAIRAEKETRTVNIGISEIDGKTVVTITVTLPVNTNTNTTETE